MIPIPLEEEPRTECCGAKLYEETDLCSDCKEHADLAVEEHEVAPIIEKIFNLGAEEIRHPDDIAIKAIDKTLKDSIKSK